MSDRGGRTAPASARRPASQPLVIPETHLETLAGRFAPHIELLQEFFVARGVPFGAPEDMFALAERLSRPGPFHDGLASMLRTIVYREGMTVTRVELLEMVSVASAGTHLDEAAQDIREPVAQVLLFVSEVLGSMRRRPFEEPVAPRVVAEDATPGAETEGDRKDNKSQEAPPVRLEPPDEESSPPEPPGGNAGLPTGEAEPQQVSEPVHFYETSVPAVAAAQSPFPVRRRSRPVPLLLGFCVVALVALLALLFVRGRARPGPAAEASSAAGRGAGVATLAAPAGSVAAESKPNAYEPPLAAAGRHSERPSRSARTAAAERAPATKAAGSRRQPRSPAGGEVPANTKPALAPEQTAPEHFLPGYQYTRQGVFLSSSGIMAGHLLSAPAPAYPRLASFARVQGEVILQAAVGKDGRVVDTHVLRGHRLLRSAAVHAVRRWRYRPYMVDGRPAQISTVATVDFRLYK